MEDPVAKEPGLKILRGNISPAGAIVRPTAVYEEVMYIKGAAKVYECDQDAYKAPWLARSWREIFWLSVTKAVKEHLV